ncbi:MAG: hypothetical protein MRZ79_18005 [Bacteroidia bacterium]|nr:hypothetical protein [Bacteroidia bacterium]
MIEILLQLQNRGGEDLQRDMGPLYAESNFDNFVVEPINGISAIFFIIISAYFAWILRGKYKQHLFMTVSLGILLIGGIGGTIYHLFRQYPIFLHMDWLPIMILCMAAGAYFFIMSGGSWRQLGIISAIYTAISFAVVYSPIREGIQVNINYVMMAVLVIVPVYLVLRKTDFFQSKWIYGGIAAFAGALTFRVLDFSPWVRENLDGIGTHFLWHLLGGVACFCIFQYVYMIGERSIALAKAEGSIA